MENEKRGSAAGRDYVGTFLDTVQSEAPASVATPEAAADDKVRPLRILAVLRDHGSQTIPTIQAAAGIEFEAFAEAVATFRQAGLVTIQGEPGRERLELTATGAQIAGAATPP
jgi:predicted transcriptional regulator